MTTAKDFECRRISVTICARKGETEIKCLRIVYAECHQKIFICRYCKVVFAICTLKNLSILCVQFLLLQ